jgi:hypothetical protein
MRSGLKGLTCYCGKPNAHRTTGLNQRLDDPDLLILPFSLAAGFNLAVTVSDEPHKDIGLSSSWNNVGLPLLQCNGVMR